MRIDWVQVGDSGTKDRMAPGTRVTQGAPGNLGITGKEWDGPGWAQPSIGMWTWRCWGRPAREVRWEVGRLGRT